MLELAAETGVEPVNSRLTAGRITTLLHSAIVWCREPELNRDLLGFNQSLSPFELPLQKFGSGSRAYTDDLRHMKPA